jgi:hypothetical protein
MKWTCAMAVAISVAAINAGTLSVQQAEHEINLVGAVRSSDADMMQVPASEWLIAKGNPPAPTGGVRPQSPLSVTLLSLDRTSYVLGDQVTYEISIRNVSDGSVKVPLSSTEHQFRRSMPGAVRATFGLTFTDDLLGGQIVGHQSTVGSDAVQGSLLSLSPGESVRVMARESVFLPLAPRTSTREWIRVVYVRARVAVVPMQGVVLPPSVSLNAISVQLSTSP